MSSPTILILDAPQWESVISNGWFLTPVRWPLTSMAQCPIDALIAGGEGAQFAARCSKTDVHLFDLAPPIAAREGQRLSIAVGSPTAGPWTQGNVTHTATFDGAAPVQIESQSPDRPIPRRLARWAWRCGLSDIRRSVGIVPQGT